MAREGQAEQKKQKKTKKNKKNKKTNFSEPMTKTLFVVGFCFFCFFLVCLFFLVCHQTFWLSLIFVLPANAGHGRICGCILAGNVKNTASTRQLGKNALHLSSHNW